MPDGQEERGAPAIGRPTQPRPDQPRLKRKPPGTLTLVVLGMLAGLALFAIDGALNSWVRSGEPIFARALNADGLTPTENSPTAWHAIDELLSVAGVTCRTDGHRYTHIAEAGASNAFWSEAERLEFNPTLVAAINLRGPWPPLYADGVTPSTQWELWRGRRPVGSTFYALWEGEDPPTLYTCEAPFYSAPRSRRTEAEVRTMCRDAVASELLVPRSARWTSTPAPEWDVERLRWTYGLRVESQNAFGVMIPHRWFCTVPEGRAPVVSLF